MTELLLPYFESIPVGSGVSGTPVLTAGYRYVHYTTPQADEIVLLGFSANFQDSDIRITLAQQDSPDVWVPFYTTSMVALIGAVGQAEPVLYLPRPFRLTSQSRLQITLHNNDAANFSPTILTLVGNRIRRGHASA
jgi:hypothetical protein